MEEEIKLLEAIIATQKDLIAKKDETIKLQRDTIRILRLKINELFDVLGVDHNAERVSN